MMRNSLFGPALAMALLVGFSTLTAHAVGAVSTFSGLPATDTLLVRFVTQGCFHSATHEFTFRRGASSTVAVASIQLKWSGTRQQFVETERQALGLMVLDDADLKALDALLRFYRSGPRGGCTTADSITMTQTRDGGTVATEQFTDSSCRVDEVLDVLTFPETLQQLRMRVEE